MKYIFINMKVKLKKSRLVIMWKDIFIRFIINYNKVIYNHNNLREVRIIKVVNLILLLINNVNKYNYRINSFH